MNIRYYDPRHYQPIGSWQAIDAYWDEIDGPDDAEACTAAKFEGYDAEGLARYSNVDLS